MRSAHRSGGYHLALAPLAAAAALSVAILTTGCGSSGSAGPSTGAKPSGPPPCQAGTLGLEAAPITRELRKKLSLASDFRGGIVAVVYPGGPAAEAGILPNDVVEQVGSVRIGNDCELEDAAFSRSCETVRVKIRRGASSTEMAVTPADQNFFYDKLCRSGVTGGCYRQGWALWVRDGGKGADRAAALELLHAACKSGSSDACAYQGLKLMNLPNRGSDAIVALERSCLLNNGAGCTHLGFLHATGKLVQKDDRRAVARYVKGCDLGDAKGCYNVGLMAEEGRGGAKDLSRAAAKYDEGCRMGSSTACTNLGFLYERGHGVKLDKARAVSLYQRGCDGTSCQPPNL
ncbi:MAG TPA: PDZ domain-containing protein, partial [Thermoanaerobaculia bacterium]